jgi:hypothetical protein
MGYRRIERSSTKRTCPRRDVVAKGVGVVARVVPVAGFPDWRCDEDARALVRFLTCQPSDYAR